jgi:hypothetical protein
MTAANEALSTDKPAAVTFNTLAAAQDLRKSGLEDRQAEAIVTTISKAMSETVATKADLELQGSEIRKELELQGSEIRKELELQGVAIRKEMELQNAAIRAEIESLKQSMASMQDKIVIRLGALMVSMTFLLLAFGPFYIRWVMSLMASQ